MKHPKMDPIAMAKLKRAARCPDCNSNVTLRPDAHGPNFGGVEVAHDDTCPRFPSVNGRTQIALVRGEDQSDEEFARAAVDFIRDFSATYGKTAVRMYR